MVALIGAGVALSAGGQTHADTLKNNLALSLILAVAYAAVLGGPPFYLAMGWRGEGTVGMRAMHLRVVDAVSGAPPTWRQCVLRLSGLVWCVLTGGFGFLWLLVDRRRRGLQDHLAGTVVVRQPQVAWSMVTPSPPRASDSLIDEAVREPRTPWTWTDVLPVLVLFYPAGIGLSFVIGGLVRFVHGGSVHGTARALLIGLLDVLTYGADLLLMYALLHWRRHARLSDIGWRRPEVRWLIAAVPLGLLTYAAELPLGIISQALFPSTPNNQCTDIKDAFGSLIAVAIVTTAVVAPIAEETVFRGFVFGWLRSRMTLPWAVTVSAALFSAAHFAYGQPTVFLPIFGVGVLLAMAYQLSRSVWTGVIMHGTLNLFATLLVFHSNTC
jgi:membrane protease YdiL (CAAX protease family)/uncharacterized RDD family membrane protein YckC